MKDANAAERVGFLVVGAVIGASVALLMAPESGEKTRRMLRRKGEDAAEYLAEAGEDILKRCEDLYKRSADVMGDASDELSDKYRELSKQAQKLVDEAGAILRRAAKG